MGVVVVTTGIRDRLPRQWGFAEEYPAPSQRQAGCDPSGIFTAYRGGQGLWLLSDVRRATCDRGLGMAAGRSVWRSRQIALLEIARLGFSHLCRLFDEDGAQILATDDDTAASVASI